jgi:hypothetical protein
MSWFSFPGEPLPEGYREPDLEGVAAGRPGSATRGRPGVSGRPEPAPPATFIQIPPPELAMYPAATSLYGEGDATIANGASSTVVTLQLPNGQVGVINSWIIYGVNLVTGLDAAFELLISGAVVPGGRRAIPPQNAAAGSIGWGPDEILFRIPDGGTVEVRISVTAGGPLQLGAQVSGWQYPGVVGDRFSAPWRT